MLGAAVVVLESGTELGVLSGGALVAEVVELGAVVVVEAIGWLVTAIRMRLIVILVAGFAVPGWTANFSIFCATSSPEVTVPNRA